MIKSVFAFILSIVLFFPAKSAVIRGIVTDKNTGETLVGCSIYIKELEIGTTSGLDGSYILKNIPVGNYTVSGSYISYTKIEQNLAITDEAATLILDFQFLSANTQLDEVTIIGHTDKSTEKSARNSEKNALNIINVMSARTIELSPDLDVANVIQRMSGVTVERSSSGKGQYAILRGMDKRYNYTLVNGIKIPSTDNKYRYLPLDMFPSDMVDRLEVTKALTPDMEADAIGGAVNMMMKDAPGRLQIKANAAIGYSRMFLDRDFMTFDSKSIREKSPYEIHGSNYNATENDFPATNLDINPKKFVPNQLAGLSLGNRFCKNKLGVMVAGSYLKKYSGNNSLYFSTSSTKDERNLPALGSKEDRQYNEEQTQYGIHNKVDFRFNARNSLKLYNAFIHAENNQIRDLSTIEFNSYEPGNGTYTQNYETRNRFNVQQLINITLQGEHLFAGDFNIKWSGVYSKAENRMPDYTKISLVSDVKNFEEQHIFVVEKSCSRRWTRNNDVDLAGYLDIDFIPVLFNLPVKLSIGGLYRDKQRTGFYNQYTLIPLSERPAPFQYFSEKGVEWTTYSEIHWEILNPPDPTHPLNYDASEDIIAGYFQFDFQIWKMQLTGGIRTEHTDQGYILHYEQYGSDPIGNQLYTDVLPSLHIKYRFTPQQNFRLSYYRALNRPGFLEIVPYEDNRAEEHTEAGNPELKHALADNFDIRYEYFPKEMDQFMIGFFYKNIQNPIEYSFLERGATSKIIYTPQNFGTARNFGVEIDVIRYFRNFGIKANYTWTHSDITTTKLLLQRNAAGDLYKTYPDQSRPLYGQAEHMANISLLYKSSGLGWDAQLAASYSSDRIAVVSQYLDNDIWEKGSVKLDLSTEKQLCKNFGIFIKANNLLNTPREEYIKKINPEFADYPGQHADTEKTLVRRDYFMSSYLIGFRYKFN